MKTLGDFIFETIGLIDLKPVRCRRCRISFVKTEGDFCESCIEDIIEGES